MSKFFYQIPPNQVMRRLETDAQKGLSSNKIKSRRGKYGSNKLKESKKRPTFLRLLDQFEDLLIIVLVIAALLSYYLGDFRGGTILLIIVLINALIGFYQEHKAEKILESLKKIIKGRALVIKIGRAHV